MIINFLITASLGLFSLILTVSEFKQLFEHVETIELDDSHLLGNHPRLTVDQKGEQFVIGDALQDEVLLFNGSGDFISELDPESCFPGADWSPNGSRGIAIHDSGNIMVVNRFPYAVWFDDEGRCTRTFTETTDFTAPKLAAIMEDYIIAVYSSTGSSEILQSDYGIGYHIDIFDLDGNQIKTVYKEDRYPGYLRNSSAPYNIDIYENEAIVGVRPFPELRTLKNNLEMSTVPARPSFFREFGDDIKDPREVSSVQEMARLNREFVEGNYLLRGVNNIKGYVVLEYNLGMEKKRSYAVTNNKGNVMFEYHVDHTEELGGDPMGVTYFDDSCDRYLYSLHHPENVDGSGEGSMNPSIKVYKLNTGGLQ